MRAFAALAVLALVACARSSVDPSVQPPPAAEDVAWLGLDGGVGLAYFHFAGHIDAVDVAFSADGHFRWTIDGCDFGHVDEGTWRVVSRDARGITIELAPRRGMALTWVASMAFNQQAESVTARVDTEHGRAMEVTVDRGGGKSDVQAWAPGRVCAVCGHMGPIDQPRACP